MSEALAYTLPDFDFVQHNENGVFIWVPDKTYVVLGQRDKPENALPKNLQTDIEFVVIKRPSGGHSVVLTPNTLVISIHGKSLDISQTKQWFRTCSNAVIQSLQRCGIKNAQIDGISDITLNNRKILGSSMYRGKDKTWWHGVLNLAERPEYIARFLAHPATEPAYRKQRSHSDFITSLEHEGFNFDSQACYRFLSEELKDSIIMKSRT